MRANLLDLILIGVGIYVVLRYFAGKNTQDKEDQQQGDDKHRALDAYKRAERSWDALRSNKNHGQETPAQQAGPRTRPEDLRPDVHTHQSEDNDREFIAGAKLAYARIREAWDARDLDDLRKFTTEKAYEQFTERSVNEPRSAKTELLLVNANLMDKSREGLLERATVHFDVLLRVGSSTQSTKIQEVWIFEQDTGDQNSHWKLASTRKAGAENFTQ